MIEEFKKKKSKFVLKDRDRNVIPDNLVNNKILNE